jgi:predicted nucleotidyltransferase
MAFDIEGARQAGYSDGEIAQFLGSQSGFDVEGAIKSGYEPGEIVGFLSGAGDDRVPDTSDPLTRITPSVSSSNPTLTVSPMTETGQRSVLEKQPARPEEFDFRKATAAGMALDDPRNKAPSLKAGAPGKADPNVARGADLADSSLPVRAAAKAATGLAQGVGGVVRAAGDLAGVDSVARFGAAAGKGARAFEEGMGQSGPIEGFGPKSPLPYLKDMAEGATSSLGQSALFAAAFGPAGVIPAMSIQSAGQEYDLARSQGLTPAMALAGAIPKGAFEAIGEKFTGLDRVAGALGTLLQHGVSDQAKRTAGEVLLKAGVREIPGEVITYLGQTGTDLIPGIGLKPDLTMAQFIDGLRDTVVQAAMMGGAFGGGSVLANAGTQPRVAPRVTAADVLAAPTVDDAIAAATAAVEAPAAAPVVAPSVESAQAVDNIAAILKQPSVEPTVAAPDLPIAEPAALSQPEAPALTQGIPNVSLPVEPVGAVQPSLPERSADAGGSEPAGGLGDSGPGAAPVTGRSAGAAVAADGGGRPAAVAFPSTLNPAGTLSVKGDAKQIRAVLSEYGITNMVPTKGGLMVGKSQAVRAQEVLSTTLQAAAPTPVEQALQRVAVAEEKQAAPSVEPEQVAEPEIDETPVQTESASSGAAEPTNALQRTANWVIREKATGAVIMETFDRKKVDALNTAKYEAVPIQEYLGSINGRKPGTDMSGRPVAPAPAPEQPPAAAKPQAEGKVAPEAVKSGKPRMGESADDLWTAIKKDSAGVVHEGRIIVPTLRVVGGDDFTLNAKGELEVVDKKGGGMAVRDAKPAEVEEFHRDLEADRVQVLLETPPGFGSNYKARKPLREMHSPSGNSFAKRQTAAKPEPLYASRPVTNAADIIAWAKSQGFKTTLPAEDMHVTVAYSSTPMDGAKVGEAAESLTVDGGKRSVEPLGDKGAVVLKLSSKDLSARWQQYRDAGASWDYEGYTPHVTLTYDGKDMDLSKVEPYAGPVTLGAEKQEALNEDKAEEYVEKAPAAAPAKQDAAPAESAKPLDHGELSIPNRTSTINAELDRYKAEQAKAQRKEEKGNAIQRRANKARAKELFEQMWPAMKDKMGARFGEKELRSTLDSMVKWEPAKFIALAEKFQREQADAPAFKRGDTSGDTLRVSQIQRAVDKLTLNWLKKPDIHILESMDDAPEPVRKVWQQQNSQGAVGQIEGFHWRGEVYIVASAMQSGSDVIRVLYHEALGHAGLRAVFGDKLDTVLKQVAIAKRAEMKVKAAQYGFDLTDQRQRMSAAEELLAEMAQDRPENTLVQKAIAIIRTFLRENVPGFASLKLTDAEIIEQFLIPARDFVENGKRGGKGAAGVNFLRVFHGSPHEFDSFDMSKVGTGEGAQAYGFGLYFAGRKAVAEYYKETLAKRQGNGEVLLKGERVKTLDNTLPDTPEQSVLDTFAVTGGDMQRTGQMLLNRGMSAEIEWFAKNYKDITWKQTTGKLYEVEIPEDGEYLLWDKPLSEQPEAVRKALETAASELGMSLEVSGREMTGEDLYRRAARLATSDQAASETLHKAGVAGIKYLDGVSRNRPLRELKREFLKELPQDADFDEVLGLIGSGTFSPANEVILKELAANDWLGFDYPAQALSAALGGQLSNFDASAELVQAVADAQSGATFNYVVFSDDAVKIEASFSRGTKEPMASRKDVVGNNEGGRSADDLTSSDFRAPTRAEIVDVLREHPLIKLREKVKRAFVVGSFAKGEQNDQSDVDILLEVSPREGYTPKELEDKYRQALMQHFVKNDIRGKDDSQHPQWAGRRVDVYFTYDASEETRPKVLLNESPAPDTDGASSSTGEGSDSAMEAMLKQRAEKPAFARLYAAPGAQPAPSAPANLSAWRDATGRLQFAPGAWLEDKIGQAATPLLNKLLLKAASPELRKALREMKLQVAKAQETAAAVAAETNKMSADEREMVSDLIEKELKAGTVPPAHAVKLAATINATFEAQTDELVRLGMLTKDSADRWRGQYLPRYYESKLTKGAADLWSNAMRGLGRKAMMSGIKGKHLKGRGISEPVTADSVAEWEAQGWEVRDPDYPKATADDINAMILDGKIAPEDQVLVWRDYTREERDKMGEIRDAGFRFVMGYMQTQKDVALGRMFEQLATNPEMSSRLPTEQFSVQVPESKVAGTGAKTYGKLAGRYVSKETLSQLSVTEEASNELLQMYRKALGLWKEGKVVLNPVSHVNNTVSNLTMAHFAGIGYHRADKYLAAMRDFAKQSAGIKEAKEAGLFLGTMSDAELMNVLPEELKILAQKQEGTAQKVGRHAFNLLSFYLRKPMGWAYQAEDTFFRYLVYKEARSRGLEPNDAVDYAQKYIFTYDDLPKGARRIRDYGMPFFAYTYKAIPALLHTALTHPDRFAGPAAVLWFANAAAYAIGAGDDDDSWDQRLRKYVTDPEYRAQARAKEKLEREHLPPWMKGTTALGTPKAIRLGMDEVTKLPLFMDTSRLIPGGDLFDVNPNAGGIDWLPQPFTPSHPLFTTAVGMLANKDLWLGKDLTDSNDTSGEKFDKRADWLWKQFAPAIAVNNYHWERGMNALANATGKELTYVPDAAGGDATGIGRDGLPVQPKLAAMQTFGIKVRPYDLDKAEQIETSVRRKMIREIDAEMRSLKRLNNLGALSDRAYEKARDLADTKKDRLKEGKTVDGED